MGKLCRVVWMLDALLTFDLLLEAGICQDGGVGCAVETPPCYQVTNIMQLCMT